MADWFDDDYDDEDFPNLRRLPLPQRIEKLPQRRDLEAITLSLQILSREREQRPEIGNSYQEPGYKSNIIFYTKHTHR